MAKNAPKDDDNFDEIDGISQRIMVEIESESCKELLDSNCTKSILQLIDTASSGAENEIGKKAVVKAMLFSTWLQRLYFIIRSAIMGLISTGIIFLFVLYLGSIGATLAVVMGIVVFVTSLAITRLFDEQIVKLTKSIVEVLAHHKTIRDFVVNHF
ncbi:MAG: hypothetical protein QG670_401 [Thermoproteota archaeon]|nr:hypothetical protein [Thermoproteota archaeon]